MAVWRTKAYELFDLRAGSYSYRDGKRDLLWDLVERARCAIRDEDHNLVRRIAEYVIWAAQQNSDELASVVDLAFFKKVFEDEKLCVQIRPYLPESLFNEKWNLLHPSDD